MDIKPEIIIEDEDSQWELMIKQTRHLESSESMKKCGEIYLKEYQSFVIICVHCNTLFSKYDDFIYHLKFDHGSVLIKSETVTKNDANENSDDNEVDDTNFVEVPNNSNIKLEIDFDEETTTTSELPNIQNKENSELKKEIKKRIRSFPCKICNLKFKTKKSFNEHEKSYHTKEIDKDLTKNNQLISKKEKSEKVKKIRMQNYCCESCDTNFRSKQSLLEHKKIFHDIVTSNAELQNESDIPSRFECSICKKPYAQKEFLRRHENSHKSYDEHPFKCESCTKTFSSKVTLDAHIRWHNNDILPCRVCGKAFYRKDGLRDHEKTHGEKTLLCTICGKKCFKSSSLRDHMMRHQGIKPHKCDFCDMSFASSVELVEHRRKHTKEKPYECDICKARFTIRKSLNMHKKLHSDTADYQCNICGKSFKQFAGLYVHKKSH